MLKAILKNPAVDLLVTLVMAAGIAYVVQLLVVKPFVVPSESMVPTLAIGDRILGVRFLYHLTSPQRGDIIVFHPNGQGEDSAPPIQGQPRTMAEPYYVKRLIGLPGEEVGSHGGTVWVCAPGARAADLEHPENTRGCAYLKEPYTHGQKTWQYGETGQDLSPINVPKGEYLMLGDNRELSRDGRFFGTVLESQFRARAFMTYWPLTRISFY